MNKYQILILKVSRKIYSKLFRVKPLQKPICEQNPNNAARLIYNKLMADEPCMIARLGSTELATMVNYKGVKNENNNNILQYIKGEGLPFWWEENLLNQMQQWSGFYPPSPEKVSQFCEMMMTDMDYVDILGSWLSDENYFNDQLGGIAKIRLGLLDPYWATIPWTKALTHKKVLIIHPFQETIRKQYKKRELLFKNHDILPEFELLTIKAVQSIAGNKSEFGDWFEALDHMKAEIDKTDFDICIIGAGAYGFPLAAHVKRSGKKAVHIGGSLQLLFGIRGKRWEDPTYHELFNYNNLINEHWVKPSISETPQSAESVEDGCYW